MVTRWRTTLDGWITNRRPLFGQQAERRDTGQSGRFTVLPAPQQQLVDGCEIGDVSEAKGSNRGPRTNRRLQPPIKVSHFCWLPATHHPSARPFSVGSEKNSCPPGSARRISASAHPARLGRHQHNVDGHRKWWRRQLGLSISWSRSGVERLSSGGRRHQPSPLQTLASPRCVSLLPAGSQRLIPIHAKTLLTQTQPFEFILT